MQIDLIFLNGTNALYTYFVVERCQLLMHQTILSDSEGYTWEH